MAAIIHEYLRIYSKDSKSGHNGTVVYPEGTTEGRKNGIQMECLMACIQFDELFHTRYIGDLLKNIAEKLL